MQEKTVGFGSLMGILWGRRWTIILVTALAVAIALVVSLRLQPKYSSTATVIIDFDEPAGSQMGSPLAPSLQQNYMSTQLGIISSRHVAGKVVDLLELEAKQGWQEAFALTQRGAGTLRDWIAGALLSSLGVTPGTNSRLVNISYTAGNPQTASEVANAFAEAYEQTNLEMNTKPARREAEQYSQWLEELRDNVEKAQQNLSTYQI